MGKFPNTKAEIIFSFSLSKDHNQYFEIRVHLKCLKI